MAGGNGQAGLHAEVVDAAAVEERVALGRVLVDEDGPHLGQRPRILEEERVGDRRNEVLEARVALEPWPNGKAPDC